MKKNTKAKLAIVQAPLRIDIGCSKNKKDGFVGVDQFKFDGVDVAMNAGTDHWPWADNSVEEANCVHFLEHLTNQNGRNERIHFFNELYRVLKPDAKCLLIVPHWASQRYYGDPTHCEPFSEMGFFYLDPKWREAQAPHTDKRWNPNGYACDFGCTWGYNLHPEVANKNQERQQYMMTFCREFASDMICTMTKRA